jgi:RNA polymerase sigma-70 factor (ECF subfamily)
LKGGDQQALAALFALHQDALRRMVRWRLDRRLNGRVDPSDVLQEVYIDAAERVNGYLDQPTMPFGLWLRLLVGRRLIELHRMHLGAKMRAVELEVPLQHGHWPAADSHYLASQLAGELTTPSEAVLRAEKETWLVEALNRMEPIDREVLVLRHFEELGNNEVAALLGIEKQTASNRYVRALGRLREILVGLSDLFKDDNETPDSH